MADYTIIWTPDEMNAYRFEEVSEEEDANTLYGSGTASIYGNYVASALSATSERWHIQGDGPDRTLCGKRLTGDLRRMRLHVSLLECSSCMALGKDIAKEKTDG